MYNAKNATPSVILTNLIVLCGSEKVSSYWLRDCSPGFLLARPFNALVPICEVGREVINILIIQIDVINNFKNSLK